MTITNGANHHDVEQLLASIRTSMTGDEGPVRLVAGDMSRPVRREPEMAEEAAEFELPAIFKPGHVPAPDKPKLFGRLSEALKSAPPEAEPARVIPFDPAMGSTRMLEGPGAMQMQRREHAFEPAPEPASATPGEPVARVMPTFFDTRLNRMGELTRKAFEPEPPPPAPEPPAAPAQPPALPAKIAEQGAGPEGADDAAAQLLRPMLRAWLHENMPKIVEKALLSEVQGEQVSKTRK